MILTSQVLDWGWWRNTGQTTLAPVMQGLYQVGFEVNRAVRFVVVLPTAWQENARLTGEVEDLSARLVELERLRKENEALRRQMDVAGTRTQKKILASVLGLYEEGNTIRMIIDQGRGDGVEEGQVVVDGDRLIGQVVAASQNHAYVRPIFSVDSAVPVEVVKEIEDASVARGLVRGNFNERILLTEVMHERVLNAGDLVATSGESGVYPPGLLMGRVEAVESKDYDLFQVARLSPFWRLNDVRTVFVLIGQ